MKVLLTGADGFIGRHIAFALREAGHEVIASARQVDSLSAMGFATLRADLTDPATHDPAFWRPHLKGGVALVQAAGLLTGTEPAFKAVHVDAFRAMLAARDGGPALLLSAVGIEIDTPFARWRTKAEALAKAEGATILRPGLVIARTSYGGSSALRALAALPFALPVIGSGNQPLNPISAPDLARVIAELLPLPPDQWEIGGPETVSQSDLLQMYRRWMGLAPAPLWPLPGWLATLGGKLGDWLRLGPLSTTTLRQLECGVRADPAAFPPLSQPPRGISAFLNSDPAGTQDLWQARLYFLKPLIRITLAVLWLASAALGFFTPVRNFLPDLAISDFVALFLARGGGVLDLALGIALLRNWRPLPVAQAQIVVVLGYTLGLTLMAPALWLDPFGGLLKNLPILVLLLVHLILVKER